MAFLPVAGAGHFCQQLSAFTQSGAGGGAERDHGLAGKVVGFYKAVHRPGCNAPPDGIADKYSVVAVPVIHRVGHQLHVPQRLVFMLLMKPGCHPLSIVQILVGIGIRGLQFKQVAAGNVRNVTLPPARYFRWRKNKQPAFFRSQLLVSVLVSVLLSVLSGSEDGVSMDFRACTVRL